MAFRGGPIAGRRDALRPAPPPGGQGLGGAWEQVTPFLAFTPPGRRLLRTTDSIESSTAGCARCPRLAQSAVMVHWLLVLEFGAHICT
ncbi:hypothetical protein AB0O34_36945, partial [Sphaerisporangium sp. NPDC088356]